MKLLLISLVLLTVPACAASEYRFERVENGETAALPLKFTSLSGVRDGSTVHATIQFSEGQDSAELTIDLYLRPPAEFTSGTYQANIGGRAASGMVECPSLTYLGGQAAAPSIGGVFLLKDPQGRPLYRVTMPVTLLSRQRTKA